MTLIIWGLFGILCAYMADKKGRDKILWGILGLIFGIFAVFVIYIIPGGNIDKAREYRDDLEK